jgi:hypothetical protein
MAWAIAALVALAAVLFLKNRLAAYVALAAAVVIGGVLWFLTDSEDRERTQQREAVVTRAAIDPATCPDPAKPIMVEFQNGNDRPLLRLTFDLTARLKGHSSISYRAFLRSDRIVAPGETVAVCYGILPRGFSGPQPESADLQDYEWMADISLVEFGR